ncbi:protein-tyrosine phosphatase-like protein [Gilbertella persicaria]|uniref:protein-tyrosine-phosphatase n=1 Tax=Rhizopus stolonifer TaxID=4846 RepID=A0A367K032_RHIST|nr:protein-tyrosine phosphatase-like protein [Gilbertella persicaria]KAI8069798.1 protein-tyrosine phosphatase-like protein [Gilbertella persicaria]RCH95261.1 Protein tyrosine phosphatase type IVA 1 [Rhizopus stolonifer]
MLKPPAYNKIQKQLLHPPSLIEYKDLRFLITDTPSINNLSIYIQEFERWNVTDVVRCCNATYSHHSLNEHGIQVHDWMFSDGGPPSKEIIQEWLDLVDSRFKKESMSLDTEEKNPIEKKRPCIAAHCVAGLGRAPVLVAIALIEEGMDPMESIAFIRRYRRGAINKQQIKYLENYHRRRKQSTGCFVS